MTETDSRATKERILDAAEELFTNQGFGSTSLRNITALANVNLAAVHYHFGSKESLIEAVFARRLAPLNRERLELLDSAESNPGAPDALERIVEAFVGPALRMTHDPSAGGPIFVRLLGQTISQPHGAVRDLFTRQFAEIFRRFSAALNRSLPDLSAPETAWRFMFMIGAMGHTMAMAEEMQKISGGLVDAKDVEGAIGRLVPFIVAGLRAPAASGEAGGP